MDIRFRMETHPGDLFPYEARARSLYRSFTNGSRGVTSVAMQSMMVAHITQGKQFEDEVIPWIEENLGSNHPTPRWIVHRIHRRVFMVYEKDAVAFRMRWC